MLQTLDHPSARLTAIWTELLPGRSAGPQTNFFDAGGHSLLATRLLSRIEREFGRTLPLSVFYADPTLGALEVALDAGPPARQFRFDRVTRIGQGDAKPVFAVVHSNGAFLPMGHALGQTHRFVALQAIGRRTGGSLPDTIEAIAAMYVRQLRLVEPVGPCVLLGWCLGGTVAFEAAQQLRAAGEDVAAIVMVDTWNPAYFAAMGTLRRRMADRSFSTQIILTELAQALAGRITLREFLMRRHSVRRLVRPPQRDGLPSPAAAAYLADQAFDAELLRQLSAAAKRYRPRSYPGRVLHIASSDEPRGFGLDRRYGWGKLVGDGLARVTIPGDHLSIFLEPGISQMTRHVRAMVPGAGLR